MRHIWSVLVGCLIYIFSSATVRSDEPTRMVVDAGCLKLEVHISETAHLFHVVDQLSEWDEFCHKQYGRHFRENDGGISARDKEMLGKHASVRRVRPWGQGLEQTFYTELELEAAIKSGLERGYLTADQAAIERDVFNHFKPRILRLMKQEQKNIVAFMQRIDDPNGRLQEV